MITAKDIEKETMSPEKRASAKNDYFAFYVGRPLSYVLTIPFLYTRISPNMVSVISIIPLLIGFVLMYIGQSKQMLCLGWLMFFIWNLLDGVDGNIARYKKQFSKLGSVYDAMSGYAAMVLSFFAWGIAAAHNPGIFQRIMPLPTDIYIIMGGISGVAVIFPRLVMHKVISTSGESKSTDSVKNKSEFGFLKIIALNLTSIAGFVQVLMLLAILIDMLDLFTIGYCFLNCGIMIISLYSVLKEN